MLKNKVSYYEAIFRYISGLIISNQLKFDFVNTQKVLLMALRDYFDDQINVNTLSSIATMLYYEFNKPSDFDNNPLGNTLGKILDASSELEWNLKNVDDETNKKNLEDIKKYYQKNEKLINTHSSNS